MNDTEGIYPFTIRTEGALGHFVTCSICGRECESVQFITNPAVAEVRKFMCPTCGAKIESTLGRMIRNFMCKSHHEDVGFHVMETRYH